MITTLIIALITFIGITLSILLFPHIKIKNFTLDTYWLIALLGAAILLIFSLVPLDELWKTLTSSSAINPLKILVLFFSMTIISIYLDELGLFKFLAIEATKKAGKNQFVLFLIFYLLTSILTIFTSNDIVILTLTPFICFFCKNTKINPLPYLIAEFAGANTWSMMLIIGNPTNIYLGTSAGISFIEYFKVMWLPTLCAGLLQIILLVLIFYKKLKQPLEITEEEFHIDSKLDLFVGVITLVTCLIFLVISSYIDMEMWLISFIAASSLIIVVLLIRLITHKHWDYLTSSLKRLPYQLIPFLLSMFVIVLALNYQGISSKLGEVLNHEPVIWIYGPTSFIASNIINNIPMSILFSTLPNGLDSINYTRAIYSSIIGSNIGAFFTPLGALAGIMFSSLVNKQNIKFTFLDFTKYGLIIALPTLFTALLTLFFII